MDNLEEHKGTAQLIASEASAGVKGSGGDCNDLAIRRDVVAIAKIGMREGKGDLSGSNKVVLLKKKNREKQAHYRKIMSAEKCAQERERLDGIHENETEEKYEEQKKK
jgi:hypothetical protein